MAHLAVCQTTENQNNRFRRFTTDNGLSSNRVLCVAQDVKGFLWIGTNEGVNRYDGRDFEKFFHDPRKRAHSLSGNYVRSMYAHENLMFFATDHGISVFDVELNQFTNNLLIDDRFNYKSKELFNFIIQVGKHWYVGGENVLLELNSDFSFSRDLKNLMQDKGLGVRDFTLPTIDEQGNIYFPSCGGLFYYKPPTQKMMSGNQPNAELNLGLPQQCHTAFPLLIDRESAIFFSWSSPPQLIKRRGPGSSSRTIILRAEDASSDPNVSFAYRLNDEINWLCTDQGLFSLDTRSLSSEMIGLNSEDHAQPACYYAFKDTQNNTWIASETGLYQWSPELNEFHVIPIPKSKTPQIEYFEQIVGNSGDVWATSSGTSNDIYQITEAGTFPITIPCLPKGGIRSIYMLNEHELIIGGWNGSCSYNIKSGVCGSLNFIPEQLRHAYVISMLHDSHQNLWLSYGKGNGVFRYNYHTKKSDHFVSDLSAEGTQKHIPIVNASDMVEDDLGNVWMVRSKQDGKVVKWNHQSDRFEELKPINTSSDSMHFNGETYSIAVGAGSIWFAVVREGLFRYHLESNEIEQFTRLDGLPSNLIYSLEFDDKGILWIGTSNGLSAFEPGKRVFTNFSTTHGLPSNSLSSSSFFDKEEGRMYLNCNGKIVFFDPDRLKNEWPMPKVYLTSIRVEGEDLGVVSRQFHSGENHIDFHYTAVDMIHAAAYQYRYRLEGLETEWNMAGLNKTASYANIPAGNYSFQVSVKVGGVWSEPTRLYSFHLPAIFYRTWWFALLLIVAFVMLVYGIFRFKAQRLKQMEAVRSRISRDLHDDIGSALSSIRIISARKDMTDQVRVEALSRINKSSQNMLDNMDDIIWAINPQNDTGEQLLIRMREFGSELLEAKQIEYTMHFDEKLNSLRFTLDQKRNVYLIFKEALNNAVKHSEAKQITIGFELNRATGMIKLEVKDDGRGFSDTAQKNRNGMINMKKRAEEIDGELVVNSTQGKGTVLILEFRI